MLKSVVRFTRPRVTIMLWALAFIGSASVGSPNFLTILSLPVLMIWYIHATTVNDFSDFAIDKINLKKANDRPLVSGKLSFKQMWVIHILSGITVLLLSFLYGLGAVLLTVVMLIIDYAYSLKPVRLSDRGIIAQFVLAFVYVYYPLSLGYWSNGGTNYPWVISFSIFLAFMARMLLKDFRDVVGDRKYNKMTFLLRHGTKKTVILSFVFWVLSALIMSWVVRSIAISLVLLTALAMAFKLLQYLVATDDHDKQQVIIVFIAKAANALIIMLLAFLLCGQQESISKFETGLITSTIGLVLLLLNWIRYKEFYRTVTTPRSVSRVTS